MENNYDLNELENLEMAWAKIESAYKNTLYDADIDIDIDIDIDVNDNYDKSENDIEIDVDVLKEFPSLLEQTKEFLKQFEGDCIPRRLVWLFSLMGEILSGDDYISDEYEECRSETWDLIWDFKANIWKNEDE